MNGETDHSTWNTYGSGWMYNTLISLLRYIPLKAVYWFVYIFVIPVTLLLSPGARLTYRYYHEKRCLPGIKALWTTFLNHCVFAQTVIDKFAVYAGLKFTINHNGLEMYQAMVSGAKPFLQLSAHVGCSEILGYSLPLAKRCNVLAYGGEKQALMKHRRTSFANMNIRMIPVGVGDTNVWKIVEALDNGEIINAFADRVMNKNKTAVSDIYNHKVSLAKGPFSLAVVRGLGVVMVNAMKEKDGTYSAYHTKLHYDKSLSRNQQIQQLADAYTAEIERLLDKYPLQWFNYFDLWMENKTDNK